MKGGGTIEVEVACACCKPQFFKKVKLCAGATIADAIEKSGLAKHFLEIDMDMVGVHSRRRKADSTLKDGDRVEAYTKLAADVYERRRQKG